MKIDIQSPGIAPNHDLEMFAEQEVKKLSQIYHGIISSDVCLSLDSSSTKENKHCRIRLVIPGNDLLATAMCTTFEEAITQTTEALEKQIAKQKTKRKVRQKKLSGLHNKITE